MHEYSAPLFGLDAVHVHHGQKGGVINPLVEHLGESSDHAPLGPGGQEAFPCGPEICGQLQVFVLVLLDLLWLGLLDQVRVDAELFPLLPQLSVFLFSAARPGQEVVADCASEFFSTSSAVTGLPAASM